MMWLIGFRAAGKTTLGRALAAELGSSFLDLDEELERREGRTILELVAAEGEAAFRDREEALLREVGAREGVVVATGGGCVEREATRDFLATHAWPKVWIDPPAETLWARLEAHPERREIGHLKDFNAMRFLWEKRRLFYEKIATYRLGSQDISECLALIRSHVAKPQ